MSVYRLLREERSFELLNTHAFLSIVSEYIFRDCMASVRAKPSGGSRSNHQFVPPQAPPPFLSPTSNAHPSLCVLECSALKSPWRQLIVICTLGRLAVPCKIQKIVKGFFPRIALEEHLFSTPSFKRVLPVSAVHS